MNKSVPHLNLAPGLKRPLQLWNPLDYLRLLFWVFFSPQALHWYAETFIDPKYREAKGKDLLTALLNDIVLRHLILQALVLVICIPYIIAGIVAQAGLPIDWFILAFGLSFGVALGVVGGVASGLSFGVALGVVGGVAFGLALGVFGGVAFGMTFEHSVFGGVALGVVGGVAFGLAMGVASGLAASVALGIDGGVDTRVAKAAAYGVTIGVTGGVIAGVALGVILIGEPFGLAYGLAFGLASGLAAGVASGITLMRPEMWGLGALYFALFAFPGSVTRISPLSLPGMRRCLREWLQTDWPTGVHNLNELLAYSSQFVPVVQALNDVLAEQPPERLIAMVDEVAKDPYDWHLLRFASAPLVNKLIEDVIDGVVFLPKRWKRRLVTRYPIEMRFNTPGRAACAGFWCLHEKQLSQAVQAFTVVRSLPEGEEMYRLSQALLQAQTVRNFDNLADLAEQTTFKQVTMRPSVPASILHPTTWQAIEHLQQAALEAHAMQQSVSRAARSQSLNRALGEVVAVQEMIGTLPKAEHALVEAIAINWQKTLLSLATEVGRVSNLKPVKNPYVVGDPVVGAQFVGREDIIRRLEALWRGTVSPPSVVLYGHRRMGKTSILRNIDSHLRPEVRLAYLSLLTLGEAPKGVSDLFLAMADTIRVAIPELPQPDVSAFDRRPYRAFEQFLEQVSAALGSSRLIIALDEFEKLEDWMSEGRIPRELLGVFRGYIQKDEHIAFAFAGLHTLEEMTWDYDEPLFSSWIPVKVSFLSREATFQVLVNPSFADFPLDYSREALERIWQLTSGHPYLVQLIGHLMVSRFNRLTFDQGKPAEQLFKLVDVEAVIDDPDFFSLGRYYFTGVWGQAGQGPAGQQEVLKLLAAFSDGLAMNGFMAYFGKEATELKAAFDELVRHDVLNEKEGHWRYSVELMRRWVKELK